MSRIVTWRIPCLASVVFSSAATAQLQTERAPVPRQVLNARAVIIGNGGSETYGAASYFGLTRYDGGPNRAYNSFYAAMKDWGHFDLVGSTDFADLALVIRYLNPVVGRQHSDASDPPNGWIYDPQLQLSINDPRTGLALWSITEHIQPADDRQAANQHFDEAVARLVDDLKKLIFTPELATSPENNALPPGAIEAARERQREEHAGIGMLLGFAVGGIIAARSVNDSCDFLDIACFSRVRAKQRTELIGTIGGAIVGAMVGWALPVSF